MNNINKPLRPNCINAPVEKIHFCPICHNPFLDEPKESSIVEGLMVCPHCRKQENELFLYWMNYKPFIEKDKLYHIDDGGAFLVNGRYVFAAFRVDDGSWDYTLVEIDMSLIDSGQIGDENTSFFSVMESILKDNYFSIYSCEEIPWPAAFMILELYNGDE